MMEAGQRPGFHGFQHSQTTWEWLSSTTRGWLICAEWLAAMGWHARLELAGEMVGKDRLPQRAIFLDRRSLALTRDEDPRGSMLEMAMKPRGRNTQYGL
jgi:hypothetical protein